jgi:hypothetical protein
MSRLILPGILGVKKNFPEIVGSGINVISSTSVNLSITSPNDYQNGDYLITLIRTLRINSARTITELDGFSILKTDNFYFILYQKIKNGGKNIYSLVLSHADRLASITYLIRNADDIGVETISSIDPPAINPNWGLAKNLYLTGFFTRQCNQEITGTPNNYTDLITSQSTPGSTSIGQLSVYSMHRYLESLSENPSQFVSTNISSEVSFTIGIKGK